MSKIIINKALEAAEHPILLETTAQLDEAAKAWRRSDVLGIDTEFVRERTYRADLGLVQVSDGETAWLFDPLAIREYGALREMFENPDVLKLLHSGSEDLEVLLNTVGAIPRPLIDTQIACAMQGQSLQLGYHHAIKWLFDVEIEKDQTRSNWCKRPLSSRQLHYAAMDVVLLPEMLRKLQQLLDQTGRWPWLEEEVERMQRNALTTTDPDYVYMRLAGIGRMDQESLQVLRYLARWREGVADEKNRARGFVISDSALLQLARDKPADREQLEAIRDIHPVALARYGETLLELIAAASGDSSPVETFFQLDAVQRQQLKRMRDIVGRCAKELCLDPAMLASRRELEKLIRAREMGEPLPERFLGWRKAVVTDQLIAVFEKES